MSQRGASRSVRPQSPRGWRRRGHRRSVSLVGLAGVCLVVCDCSQRGSDAVDENTQVNAAESVTALATPPVEATPAEVPTRVDIGVKLVDPGRWLFVEAVRGDAKGGWATGMFDDAKNKLTIDTHDVARFAVHVDELDIDWERLVIIRMDGVNTELRKRDFAVYHFELDEYGRWNVLPS